MHTSKLTLRRRMNVAGWLLVAGAVAGLVRRAWLKGLAHEPEWSFWTSAAGVRDVSGLEGMLYGYLPGVVGYLRPFVALPEPWGLALFIAVGLGSCAAMLAVLRRDLGPSFIDGSWLVVWLAAPCWIAVQNNQLVAPMAALGVLAIARLSRGDNLGGGLLFAAAAIVKTPILALGPWLALRRRWVAALSFGAAALGVSLAVAVWWYGPGTGLELHRAWPAGVLGQDPVRALAGTAPASFRNNQSAAAWIVMAAPWIGELGAIGLRRGLFWLTLIATAVVEWRRDDAPWPSAARWLAWSVFAAPFGRYYYLLSLVPAWWLLARGDGPRWRTWIARALPLLAWAARGDGLFALLAGVTWLLTIVPPGMPRVAGTTR